MRAYEKCAKRSEQLVKDEFLVVLEHLSLFFFLHFQCRNWLFLCSRAWLEGQVIVFTWVGGMQDRNNNACMLTKMMAKILQFHQTCFAEAMRKDK